MRRRLVLVATAVVVSLVAASGAQAVVVNDNGSIYGVALVPGTTLPSGVTAVTSSAPCSDPWLASDLGGPLLPTDALCSHSGVVMHNNETFDLAWDPLRRDWATTRNFIEQFMREVANGSGALTSPYAVTSQYNDAGGHAQNASLYGGGCIDYGSIGGATCQFGSSNGSGAGHDYPGARPNCPVSGTNQFHEFLGGGWGSVPNDICLTDLQLQGELNTMITQEGLSGHTEPGYTPMLVLMTPPGVEVCLDALGTVCSANGASSTPFCSYHSHLTVGGTDFAYVVLPWTASWTAQTGCTEPDAPVIPTNPSVDVIANDVGAQLVSPLSQGHIAAIVNPDLNGWFALNGSEINDNGCVPLGGGLDNVTVGSGSYVLQREFNNAGVIESDPNALSCTPAVQLAPTFVVPSAVNAGDVVEFDGSKTVSSLMVAKAGYTWNFGDGTTAVGPSVVHTYPTGGDFTVKLTVTDRGANSASVTQTISVLGANGQPVPPAPPIETRQPAPVTPAPPTKTTSALLAHVLLLPQGLRGLLRDGIFLRVTSNEPADGFVTLTISRGAAKRAHIRTGRGPTVVVGRGTVSGVKDGTVNLRVMLSHGMAKKLAHLRHVTLTVRMVLKAAGGAHVAVDAAGRY